VKSRSLVFDLYGDYVRYYGGEIGVPALAELLECFEVTEATTRVTLSRLKGEGWLETRRVGRRSWYALTDRSWRLLDTGRDRIFKRRQRDWDGTWQMVIYQVPEAERPTRERLRNTLGWLGFGSLAPSTWVSPHDRGDELRAAMVDRDISAQVDHFAARTGSAQADRELAARCWDLDGLQASYQTFIETHAPMLDRSPVDDREAFIDRVQLVHAYRKFPFDDPDLPLDLLPDDWAGSRAHALFLQIYEHLREPAFRHFHRVFEHPPEDGARD
jgi:phenylacetic acid degradation operon negative regulatory protein